MSRVNLLPPEIRQRAQIRRRFFLVVAAGVAVLALVVFFYFLQQLRLSGVNGDLEQQRATNEGIQTQINGLQQFAQLQAEVQAKQAVVDSVFVGEISWSSVLLDISRSIPPDAYIQSFQGQVQEVAVPEGAPAGATAAQLIGNVSLAGTGSGTDSVTLWLTRLDLVRGFANAFASSLAETTETGGIYTFSTTVDLTADALTRRGGKTA